MNFSRYKVLLTFWIILFSSFSILSQSKVDVNYEVLDEKILIHYTIQSDPEAEYSVKVFLRRSSVPSFKYSPANISGSVGEGKFAVGKKTIVWNVSESEMDMFDGDDFYFEVVANKIESGGGIPWYYYAGAGVVAGVAAIVLGGSSGGDGGGTTTTDIPQPPARPNGNN